MSMETTSQTMRSYLDVFLARGNFADYFIDEVTWTTVGTGQELQGRQPVRDFLIWMHTQAFYAHPKVKTLVIGNGQNTARDEPTMPIDVGLVDWTDQGTREFCGSVRVRTFVLFEQLWGPLMAHAARAPPPPYAAPFWSPEREERSLCRDAGRRSSSSPPCSPPP